MAALLGTPAKHPIADQAPPPAADRRWHRLVLGWALTLLAAAGSAAGPGDPVTIAGVDYLGDLPTLVADQRGLFREALGDDVRVEYGRSGRDNLERLLDGEVTFATMALTPAVLHEAQGLGAPCVRVLAGLHSSDDTTRLVAGASAGVMAISDLAGGTVGIMPGTSAGPHWWHLARQLELPAGSVTLKRLPITTLGDALLGGSVDAALLWDPWPAIIEAQRAVKLRSVATTLPLHTKWVLVAAADTLATQPERTWALLGAYRDAINLIEREPEASIALLAARHDLPTAALATHWATADFDLIADWSLILQVSRILQWLNASEPMKHEVDVGALFDFRPLRFAHPAGVSLTDGALGGGGCAP